MARHSVHPDKVDPPAAKRDILLSDLTETVAAKANKDERIKGSAEFFLKEINANKEQWSLDEWKILYREFAQGCFEVYPDGRKSPDGHKITKRIKKPRWSNHDDVARVYLWILQTIYPDNPGLAKVRTRLLKALDDGQRAVPPGHLPEALSLVITNPHPVSSKAEIVQAQQKAIAATLEASPREGEAGPSSSAQNDHRAQSPHQGDGPKSNKAAKPAEEEEPKEEQEKPGSPKEGHDKPGPPKSDKSGPDGNEQSTIQFATGPPQGEQSNAKPGPEKSDKTVTGQLPEGTNSGEAGGKKRPLSPSNDNQKDNPKRPAHGGQTETREGSAGPLQAVEGSSSSFLKSRGFNLRKNFRPIFGPLPPSVLSQADPNVASNNTQGPPATNAQPSGEAGQTQDSKVAGSEDQPTNPEEGEKPKAGDKFEKRPNDKTGESHHGTAAHNQADNARENKKSQTQTADGKGEGSSTVSNDSNVQTTDSTQKEEAQKKLVDGKKEGEKSSSSQDQAKGTKASPNKAAAQNDKPGPANSATTAAQPHQEVIYHECEPKSMPISEFSRGTLFPKKHVRIPAQLCNEDQATATKGPAGSFEACEEVNTRQQQKVATFQTNLQQLTRAEIALAEQREEVARAQTQLAEQEKRVAHLRAQTAVSQLDCMKGQQSSTTLAVAYVKAEFDELKEYE